MADGSPIDLGFSEAELQLLLENLDSLSEAEIKAVMAQIEELERRKAQKAAQDDLIEFCKRMQPDYKVGRHHRILADQLMALEAGSKDRVCVNMPPRHGKSQLVSVYYPAWFLGRNPGKKVMMVSHTTDLAVDFGRKVRNLIASSDFAEIFPDVSLAADSKSAGRWNTTYGGEYFACGVGSALAGRGADLLLIDDPHSEQDVLNGNFEVFKKAYEWFTYGARTRLMPGGRVAVVQCMTGDTPVLRPDGSETPLRDIRVGDEVASYKNGTLVSRKVLNWASQGVDAVFTITTRGDKTVKANARHPFLVRRDGVETWVKVRDLQRGDTLVSITAGGLGKLSQSQAYATGVSKKRPESGGEFKSAKRIRTLEKCAARPVANSQRYVRGCADSTTTLSTGPSTKRPWTKTNSEITTCSASMALASPITATCWKGRGTDVPSALRTRTMLWYQKGSEVVRRLWLTTATRLEKFGSCCATAVTSLFSKESQSSYCSVPFGTSTITSVTLSGEEEVFDIQVEDTENFIANGLVSHNTRWHADDLTGRLVRDMTSNEGADQYEVVEFPAILDVENRGTGETIQKPLWPEFFDLAALLRTKASMPAFQWNSQYMQNPTGEESSIIKREWWRIWPSETLPHVEYVIMALDAAAEATNRADFTSLTTWGVFYNEEEHEHQIVLMNAIKRRLEFPELKALAIEEYKEWEPDAFIVEKKSSGTALYQEMRRSGLLVQEYTPVRGTANNPNTKMARLNSVSDILASGLVWVPPTRWAEDLVEEVAGFPFASNDDQVDTTIMALMRFRQGGFIRLPTDEPEDEVPYRPKVEYY